MGMVDVVHKVCCVDGCGKRMQRNVETDLFECILHGNGLELEMSYTMDRKTKNKREGPKYVDGQQQHQQHQLQQQQQQRQQQQPDEQKPTKRRRAQAQATKPTTLDVGVAEPCAALLCGSTRIITLAEFNEKFPVIATVSYLDKASGIASMSYSHATRPLSTLAGAEGLYQQMAPSATVGGKSSVPFCLKTRV